MPRTAINPGLALLRRESAAAERAASRLDHDNRLAILHYLAAHDRFPAGFVMPHCPAEVLTEADNVTGMCDTFFPPAQVIRVLRDKEAIVPNGKVSFAKAVEFYRLERPAKGRARHEPIASVTL